MKVPEYGERRASLERQPDSKRMAAALSSAEPVPMPFGVETLLHTADAVDMSRAADGLPLLINHDRRALPIGRVENIRLDGDRLRGELAFSDATAQAREAAALAEDGTLTDVSIRYRVLDWERGDDDDSVTVTRWMPVETSVVSVPADASVGIGRSMQPTEIDSMSEDTKTETEISEGAKGIVAKVREKHGVGYKAGAEAERNRLNAIGEMARAMSRSLPDLAGQIEELADHCRADDSVSSETFQRYLLELIGGAGHAVTREGQREEGGAFQAPLYGPSHAANREPPARARWGDVTLPGGTHRGARFEAGGDARERAAKGMEIALLERAGTKLDAKETEGNRFRGWSLLDMARTCLEFDGHAVRGWSNEQIARAAIAQGRERAISPGTAAYVTSDFPAVTAAVVTKRVHDAYNAAEVTYQQWTSSIEVPDFKQFDVPRISQISSLPVVAENAAYTNLTQTDAREQATLVKQGGLISFSWEAIVGDDQLLFSRTSSALGTAAARTVDEKAYAVLVDNGNMGDGNALFSAPHSNTGTAPLDQAGIVAARTAIARQTDDNNQLLGIVLRYVIVPEELRDTADNLAGSEYLPWPESAPGAQRVNTVRGTFTVVATVRLTDVNDWYAAAGNGTVEIAFLAGNSMPAILRDEGWDTDAMHYKVRHPSVAYAVDWRGLYRNVVV